MKTDETPRCPECKGAMRRRSGIRGEFLGCLRWPDCRGVRQLTEQAPQVKGESEPRTIAASPILMLTQAAVAGLSTRSDMEDAIDIGETAVAIAAAALNALKRRTSRDGNGKTGEPVGPPVVQNYPQSNGKT